MFSGNEEIKYKNEFSLTGEHYSKWMTKSRGNGSILVYLAALL